MRVFLPEFALTRNVRPAAHPQVRATALADGSRPLAWPHLVKAMTIKGLQFHWVPVFPTLIGCGSNALGTHNPVNKRAMGIPNGVSAILTDGGCTGVQAVRPCGPLHQTAKPSAT